jgi:hypothetical protein
MEVQDSSRKASAKRYWRKLWHWLISVVVIFSVGFAVQTVETAFDHDSRRKLADLNTSFVIGIEKVDAFRLSKTLYTYIWNGGPQGQIVVKLPSNSKASSHQIAVKVRMGCFESASNGTVTLGDPWSQRVNLALVLDNETSIDTVDGVRVPASSLGDYIPKGGMSKLRGVVAYTKPRQGDPP